MARFLAADAFGSRGDELTLLPLNFERMGGDQFLVSNLVGDFVRLTEYELNKLIDLKLKPGDGLYEKAYAAHLITGSRQKSQRQLLALRLRSRMSFLREITPLHMFVVTLRCEHSCPYCQVSRQSTDRSRFDMSEATAQRARDIAFESKSSRIKIEFQGGEPLLNFGLIKTIVGSAKARSERIGKKVDFVIAATLALLDDAVLDFCKSNEILLSTSLDGPAHLHNKNRPRPGGNSYELAINGIRRAQGALGPDRVGALMTTTESSLDRSAPFAHCSATDKNHYARASPYWLASIIPCRRFSIASSRPGGVMGVSPGQAACMIETALAVAFSRCFRPPSWASVGFTASSIRSIGRFA